MGDLRLPVDLESCGGKNAGSRLFPGPFVCSSCTTGMYRTSAHNSAHRGWNEARKAAAHIRAVVPGPLRRRSRIGHHGNIGIAGNQHVGSETKHIVITDTFADSPEIGFDDVGTLLAPKQVGSDGCGLLLWRAPSDLACRCRQRKHIKEVLTTGLQIAAAKVDPVTMRSFSQPGLGWPVLWLRCIPRPLAQPVAARKELWQRHEFRIRAYRLKYQACRRSAGALWGCQFSDTI